MGYSKTTTGASEMTEQEQIDALKAQVNCLREGELDAISSRKLQKYKKEN